MILALDYGLKRIGVAISDDSDTIAMALKSINYKKEPDALEMIKLLIEKYSITNLVLGIPMGNEDKPTQMSLRVKEFGSLLENRFKILVIYWNEVMTSKLAGKYIKDNRKGNLDSESARIILQEYLDFKKTR